jgi:hypothetical protein
MATVQTCDIIITYTLAASRFSAPNYKIYSDIQISFKLCYTLKLNTAEWRAAAYYSSPILTLTSNYLLKSGTILCNSKLIDTRILYSLLSMLITAFLAVWQNLLASKLK